MKDMDKFIEHLKRSAKLTDIFKKEMVSFLEECKETNVPPSEALAGAMTAAVSCLAKLREIHTEMGGDSALFDTMTTAGIRLIGVGQHLQKEPQFYA